MLKYRTIPICNHAATLGKRDDVFAEAFFLAVKVASIPIPSTHVFLTLDFAAFWMDWDTLFVYGSVILYPSICRILDWIVPRTGRHGGTIAAQGGTATKGGGAQILERIVSERTIQAKGAG
jgi:hypothetical protein